MLAIVNGCVDYKVITPGIPYLYPQDLSGKKKICINGFEQEGGIFFKEEIVAYLKGANQFVVLSYSGAPDERQEDDYFEKEKIDLVISGVLKKYTGGFGGSERHYAYASAKVKIYDRSIDKSIWSKEDEIYIEGVGLFNNIKTQTQPIACKYLARKMMNDFFKYYVQSQKIKR